MKVVITGASGFLGGWALRHLCAQGIEAIGTSRSIHDPSRKIIQVSNWAEMPTGDVLLHFAETNNRYVVNDQGQPYLDSVIAQSEQLLGNRFNHFVYASSIAVYNDNVSIPRSVTEKLIAPDFYGRTKLTVEDMFLQKGGTVLRVANAYGEGMSPLNVISRIISQVRSEKAVELLSLDPVRDYVWAGDIAESFAIAADKKINGIYNIASGLGFSVRDVAETILKVAEKDLPLIGKERRPNSSIILDNKETLRDLSWSPHTSLEEGMRRTYFEGYSQK